MKTKKVDVVAGYSYPNDKNALWFDLNTNTMRYWDGEKWESSLSKGSSLPTPAAEDSSRVMLVTPIQKGTRTNETVIVPEQTCQMEDEGKQTKCTLQNVDESFVPGFSGIVILDGVEYEKEWGEGYMGFAINGNCGILYMEYENEYYLLDVNKGLTHTIKVITRETEPIYDYNWIPGVKIPVPTAEDDGKILVVTKVDGSNTSIIVPEQPAPVDAETPLTNVDLTKFVVGNTVKVTITYGEEQGGEFNGSGTRGVKSANSETFTETGVIILNDVAGVEFYIQELDSTFWIAKLENSLTTNAYRLDLSNSTIKLEYIEPNYEYQLQENSGGGGNSNGLIVPSFTYESLSGEDAQWYAKVNKLDLSSSQAPETNVFLIPIDLLSSGGDKRYTICVIDKVSEWPSDGDAIGTVIGCDTAYYYSGGRCNIYYKENDNEYVYINAYMEGDW